VIAENGVEYLSVSDLRKGLESALDEVGIRIVDQKTGKWFEVVGLIESVGRCAPTIFVKEES
jgi:hypothetical protein